jgi:hypothetical protein
MLGKTSDDGDFERSEHVSSNMPVRRIKKTFGCLGDHHGEIQ